MLIPLVSSLLDQAIAAHRRRTVLRELASDPRRLADLGLDLSDVAVQLRLADIEARHQRAIQQARDAEAARRDRYEVSPFGIALPSMHGNAAWAPEGHGLRR